MKSRSATKLTAIPERPPWLQGAVIRASRRTTEEKRSVRALPDAKLNEGIVSSNYLTDFIRVLVDSESEPAYWSSARDVWLRDFLYRPGNDLLLGTISTIASRVATAKWFLEGPERTVNVYQKILAQRCGFNAGWTFDVTQGVFDFLTQDKGWTWERIRKSKTDQNGGAIGFAHMDSNHLEVWTDPDWPVKWYDQVWASRKNNKNADGQFLHRSQVLRIVDMPSPDRELRGVGLCGLSRAMTIAQILSSIAKYEQEKLSDLPPAGMLLLNNLTHKQWQDIKTQYDTRQDNQGNSTWRDIMVLFGLNPAVPLQAEVLEFSEMPEHFDKRTVTEIAMYSFALAFNTDPRELWPVSAGTLGTATEANIQHMKAKAKGHGLVLSLVERALNDGLSLPPTVQFKFDYQDVEEDERAARIKKLKAQTISILAGTNREGGGGNVPIISGEQAKEWLVREGLFTSDELEQPEQESVAEDVAQVEEEAPEGQELSPQDQAIVEKSWRVDTGPKCRMWSDGRVERLERRSKAWRGWGPRPRLKAVNADGKTIPQVQTARLPVPDNVDVTMQDVAAALRQWDKLMPEYAGLLAATVESES